MGNFEKNKIFENAQINLICDLLYLRARDVGGNNAIMVCGSVARIFEGCNHTPKDLDFVTCNASIFSEIAKNIEAWLPGYKITKSEKRVIIYLEKMAIEIWNGETIYGSAVKYHKNIPYIISNRMKKSTENEHKI